MRTFSGKRSTLALAIAGVTAMSGFMAMPEARAEGFIDDSTLTGGIYYWQRERDRKDVTDGDKYKTNLSQDVYKRQTFNCGLQCQCFLATQHQNHHFSGFSYSYQNPDS